MRTMASFMESEGGHIIACFLLILMGAALYQLKIPKGEDLIVFSLGVLGRSMGVKALNGLQARP